MMDAISLINETLQITYTFVPKELFIIIMAGAVMLLWETFREKDNEKDQDY